jgi:hypothetical protein
MSDQILPLGVKNPSFIIDRIGRDCHRLQFLREYTHNSIQSILDLSGEPGEIYWDEDQEWKAKTGQRKLCIIDTGTGMSAEELIENLNKLASTGRKQAFDENFGIGAKVSALPHNHKGLFYISLKKGETVAKGIWLHRHPIKGYGIRRIEAPPNSGQFIDAMDVPDDYVPEVIRKAGHGTKVTFMGMEDSAVTLEAPEGSDDPTRWIVKYLNLRYFSFPQQITLKAGARFSDRTNRYTVKGERAFLDDYKIESGKKEVTGATIYWWVLKPSSDEDRSGAPDVYATGGHVAALHKDELYEMTTHRRSANVRLQQFGIIFGYGRVVIYVEPNLVQDGGLAVTPNTSRTALQIGNSPLPWDRYAEEFRENLPDELKKFIEAEAGSALKGDDSVKELIEKNLYLFKTSAYKPVKQGAEALGDENSAVEAGLPASTGRGKNNGDGNTGFDPATVLTALGGLTPTKKAEISPLYPDIRWVSAINEGGRQTGDRLEDRAAEYLPAPNVLKINRDFRVFGDMLNRLVRLITGVPDAAKFAEKVMRKHYEQLLVETIFGARQLAHSRFWSSDDEKLMYSPEALTAVVMQRVTLFEGAKRQLGSMTHIKISEQEKKELAKGV